MKLYTIAMTSRYLTRQKQGRTYAYFDGEQQITDKEIIERINNLAIPPAWKDVNIARSPRAKVQASGRDKAGRKQMIYSLQYRTRQEKAKFERIILFADALPAMRKQIEYDLARKKLTKEKVLACIVKLMDQTYFRIGNSTYAKDNQTYGITTLRSKHTTVKGPEITFDFTGKSGQHQHKTISDKQLARIIRQLDELPGYEIFKYYDEDNTLQPIHSHDVNTYIKQYMGDEYTAKDFRTWGGTLLASVELTLKERSSSTTDRKKAITRCVKTVARHLGNTPSVTRSSYIDPRIIKAYDTSDLLHEVQRTVGTMETNTYLKPEERCVAHILQSLAR